MSKTLWLIGFQNLVGVACTKSMPRLFEKSIGHFWNSLYKSKSSMFFCLPLGSFTFYVDTEEGGRGFPKVYVCLQGGREGFLKSLHRQNPFFCLTRNLKRKTHFLFRGDRSCWRLGAQFITYSQKSGWAKPRCFLLVLQILVAQMRTLEH